MSKSKKVLKKILAGVLIIVLALALAAGGFFLLYKPTVTFDASALTGSVTSGASGYLYGVAEDGVPSYNMVESLDISSASTKTAGGLQHPIGDVSNVAGELIAGGSCDYIVVYLQDMYDTWYYDSDNITEMKQSGEYDWREYIENTFFPLIKETVAEISASDYSEKIVYCLYNECDNAVWFGSWVEDAENENGGYNAFDDAGRQNFYEAWALTYAYVKSLDSTALIGGPGYYEYSAEKMAEFLSYTTENSCTPDVMIYHELDSNRSIYDFQVNVEELREIEQGLGISADTPIIVTEYGVMEDNGNPNTMAKYITQIEYSKVYANQAYWLLANNLCNTASDYNTPNSAWWVYRWYADMQGQTMEASISDIMHADVEKAIKEKRELRYKQFMGLAALSDNKDYIDALIAGADYDGVVKIKNLKETELYGKTVSITISRVTYEGLSGQVYAPETVKSYTQKCSGSLKIDMSGMDSNSAYHIVVTVADENETAAGEYENTNLQQRYEFESGTLLGNAYTYDSAYATTGDTAGMVGGMEQDGDGVEITLTVAESGDYSLKFIYGNSNDGDTADDRVDSVINLAVDSNECELSLSNTIKSEITSSVTLTYELEAGEHTVKVTHNTGTIVLDSLLVQKAEDSGEVYVMADSDRSTDTVTSYLAIAQSDGYYDVLTSANTPLLIDSAPAETDGSGSAVVYLRRGLNYIDISAENAPLSVSVSALAGNVIELEAADAVLSGSATLSVNENNAVQYISGITSESGAAQYTVNVQEAGTYKLTVMYSNNEENGVHDYNVDVVEEYITLSVNGAAQGEIYCRNTSSWDTFTTVTVNIELQKGENVIVFTNDGSGSFNGGETSAPHIALVTVNETAA
ncbi:MAG: hypothetical protein LUH82_02940 [Clostridiales bacterium]|nr:hypothetical protein [Clostridiales bacterium]